LEEWRKSRAFFLPFTVIFMHNHTPMEKFKAIPVSSPPSLSDERRKTLAALFSNFPTADIQFDWSEENFAVLVNTLDFQRFKKTLVEFSQNGEPDTDLKNFSLKILDAVDSIRSYGLKSEKRVYAGYNDERKVKGRLKKVAAREPYFYAANHNHSQTNHPCPAQFKNKIVCGDSEDVLKKLPDNCVDLIFTSPAYNFGLDYATNGDAAHWDVYFQKLFRIFSECVRVVKYGGRIAVNVQPLFSDYVPIHHLISQFFMEKKLIWKGEILWEKNNYNCKYTAWGSWKSPSNPYLKYTWEFIEIFSKGSLKKERGNGIADITADEFKKWVVAKWSIGPERKMKDFDHPALFPEELAVRVLKLFSFEGDLILDPFNGAGTTTAIAKKLNRSFLGIDNSEKYCDTARKRLEGFLL
jgi:DNA modification methylase